MDFDLEKEIGLKAQKILGKGSFATVYYCIDQSNQEHYAVKIFHKKDFTRHRLKSFRKQAQILASIQHKNVVKFNSFKQTESSLYLIMQYISGGTLKQLINEYGQQNKKFTDGEVALVIKSILEGIQYLHKFNIIHRDLKPGMYQNILVADPGDLGSIKIVDFGLSAQIQAGSPTNVKSQCGTLLYMAPEILYQPSYSKAVDIWSCAIIMYILYTGKHPIHTDGMKSQQFKQKLKSCCFPKLQDSLAENFIKNLSKIQYTQRYSVNEALRHPWITRNQQDQIPLSVNQSIHSFNISHTVSDALKFMLFLNDFGASNRIVPENYRNKIRKIQQSHEQCRVRSPSYKKYKKRTGQTLNKLKQLLIHKQKQSKQEAKNQYLDLQSPVIKKHDKLFARLFDKNKQQHSELLVLEQCRKVDDISRMSESQTLKVSMQIFNKKVEAEYEQIHSPISISCNSYSSARDKTIPVNCYDVDLPLIKISNNEKKEKSNNGIRKLNSLRQQLNSKNQHNFNYFKSFALKNEEERLKQTVTTSKSKRLNNKIQPFSPQLFTKNSAKKPQTAERGKTMSKNKEYRPMVFGIRGTYC